jgi:DNA polymerase-4
MSSAKAYRLCPEAVFVYPNFSAYKAASDQIHEVFAEVTDLIEPLSLDEAYLDVTQNKLEEPLASKVAAYIKTQIKLKTGLTASAGVGPNKFIAKVASDLRKPDGLVIVPPEKVMAFVEKLPVEKLWGVGPATAKTLHSLGLFTFADIRARPLDQLEQTLGKFGAFIHRLSFGQDDRPVETEWEPKSTGTETTFNKDILDLQHLFDILNDQAEELASDLRRKDRRGKTVTLKLRYSDFKTITRSRTLPYFTDVAPIIAENAQALLQQNTDAGTRPVRLIGISVSGLLQPGEPEQLWLDLKLIR